MTRETLPKKMLRYAAGIGAETAYTAVLSIVAFVAGWLFLLVHR